MKGKLRPLRLVRLPQIVILGTVLALVVGAMNPGVSFPALAGNTTPLMLVTSVSAQGTHAAKRERPHPAPAADAPVAATTDVPPTRNSVPAPDAVDCDAVPCIALSFDDGPSPVTTPQVLATLETRHIAATFFLVGSNVAPNAALVQRMAADGFEIGNHSYSHHDMTKMTPQQVSDELTKTQAAIVAAGAPAPTLFRPPYGAINEQLVARAGLQTALWNIDPDDWKATDPNALIGSIVATAKPGGVVDLHDIHQITADVLPAVLDQLQAKGYHFVTVSQLLHSRDRPGDAPFYGYAASSFSFHY